MKSECWCFLKTLFMGPIANATCKASYASNDVVMDFLVNDVRLSMISLFKYLVYYINIFKHIVDVPFLVGMDALY